MGPWDTSAFQHWQTEWSCDKNGVFSWEFRVIEEHDVTCIELS